jgi:hypothetical protein
MDILLRIMQAVEVDHACSCAAPATRHGMHLDRVRGYHQTPAYQKAMRKRKVWVKPLFAEAKQWHTMDRFRLRGLPKVDIEALWIATGQNLKRWLTASGWGRRHGPAGSLAAFSHLFGSNPVLG